MSEATILSYFERIEAAFCQQRGAPLLLSPLDFEKAAEWFAAGVPPEAVEEGVRNYFARMEKRKIPRRRAVCLSFAEPQVAEALDSLRAAAAGRSAGIACGEPAGERIARFVAERSLALEAFASSPENMAAQPVLCRFCSEAARKLRTLEADAGMVELEKTLAPMDEELGRLVMLESPPVKVAGWRSDALRRLKESGGEGLDREILENTAERLARQAALSLAGSAR